MLSSLGLHNGFNKLCEKLDCSSTQTFCLEISIQSKCHLHLIAGSKLLTQSSALKRAWVDRRNVNPREVSQRFSHMDIRGRIENFSRMSGGSFIDLNEPGQLNRGLFLTHPLNKQKSTMHKCHIFPHLPSTLQPCAHWHCVHCFPFKCDQSSWDEFQQIGLEEESARRIFHSSQQVLFAYLSF